MKVIIAGSRGFGNMDLMTTKMDSLLQGRIATGERIAIVSGTAAGADRMGETYGKLRGYDVQQFPADWDKYGKSAGYRRNEQMAAQADALVAFWDGKSRGTKHMIDMSTQKGLMVRVIKY